MMRVRTVFLKRLNSKRCYMKRIRYVITGVLGLALSSAVPALAKADSFGGRGRDNDRREARVEYRDTRDRDDHRDRDDRGRFDRDHDRVIVERPVVIERPIQVVAPCPPPDVDVNVQSCDVPG